ncbi:MAG: SOS response-associated peptidase [Bacteroidota bacterium]|nr:SOS response-associated peptidase [Bacteroidota bacterium]
MCFFTQQSKDAVELENRFDAKYDNYSNHLKSKYINGFTFPQTPIISNKNVDIIQNFQWGLIPHWAKDDGIKKYTLNAKIETLNEKPSYRDAVNNRCLVIADGFFEWQWLDSKGKRKQKHLISMPNDELFTFAGIWSEWKDKKSNKVVYSYSIVTTDANELLSKIHNSKKRMPVILTKENEQAWLNNETLNNFKKINIELTTCMV